MKNRKGIHISFYVEDVDDIKYVNKIKNKTDYFRKLVHDISTGDLSYDELSTKQKLENAKLDLLIQRKLVMLQDTRIKTTYADFVEKYVEVFGRFPTKQGLSALGYRAKSDHETNTFDKIKYIPKFNFNKTHGTWFGMCKLCETSNFSANTEQGIIEKLETHFLHEHEGIEAYDTIKE